MFPAIAVIFVALWQFATVEANYGGNWTALYCVGDRQRQPALNAAEHVYLFRRSTGFDGQFYHYIAHDPFLRSDLKSYVDDARLRYRRILVPLLAWTLAFGQSAYVDRAYEAVFLLSVALGVYWSSRIAQREGLSPAWGLLFLAMPAIPITADRLVVDAALAALTAGFLYYSATPSWKLFVVLACAALARETGVFLLIACCAWLLWQRKSRLALLFSLAALPMLGWYADVSAHTVRSSIHFSYIPMAEIWSAIQHPVVYPASTPMVRAVVLADHLAMAGMLLCFALAFWMFARRPQAPAGLLLLLFVAPAIIFPAADNWITVYHFGRVHSPELLAVASIAAATRNPWLLAPVAMMLPRIAIQLTPQALGILHWIGIAAL